MSIPTVHASNLYFIDSSGDINIDITRSDNASINPDDPIIKMTEIATIKLTIRIMIILLKNFFFSINCIKNKAPRRATKLFLDIAVRNVNEARGNEINKIVFHLPRDRTKRYAMHRWPFQYWKKFR